MSNKDHWDYDWHMAQLVLMRIIQEPGQTWEKMTMAINCLKRMRDSLDKHKKQMGFFFPRDEDCQEVSQQAKQDKEEGE